MCCRARVSMLILPLNLFFFVYDLNLSVEAIRSAYRGYFAGLAVP